MLVLYRLSWLSCPHQLLLFPCRPFNFFRRPLCQLGEETPATGQLQLSWMLWGYGFSEEVTVMMSLCGNVEKVSFRQRGQLIQWSESVSQNQSCGSTNRHSLTTVPSRTVMHVHWRWFVLLRDHNRKTELGASWRDLSGPLVLGFLLIPPVLFLLYGVWDRCLAQHTLRSHWQRFFVCFVF